MLTPVAARAGADFPNWLCAAAGAKQGSDDRISIRVGAASGCTDLPP